MKSYRPANELFKNTPPPFLKHDQTVNYRNEKNKINTRLDDLHDSLCFERQCSKQFNV